MKRKYSLLISGAFALVMAAVIGLSGQFELGADRSAKNETQKQQEALVEQTVEEKRQQLSDYEGLYNEQSIVLADTTKAAAEKLAEDLGARLRMTEAEDYAVLYLPEGMTVSDVYEDDAYRTWLTGMELDYYVSTAEVDANGSELHAARPQYDLNDSEYAAQTYLDYLNLQDAWSVTRGSGVKVAVIDTGIDTDHPEFEGRISQLSYDASDDQLVKDYGLQVIEDENGHGTAVAGVISAAMDNQVGIAGLAPDAELVVIKCDCDETGNFVRGSDLVFALAYAIECDVDVVNMSFGTIFNVFEKYTQLAVESDVLCIASAGNAGSSLCQYPAADENVIGVGALSADSWTLADYSNYGDNSDLLAPGTVYTTQMDGGYGYATGTSLASPIVAAAAVLYRSQHPDAEFSEMLEMLQASSVDLGILGEDWLNGFGALDIHALLQEGTGHITYEMQTDELENTQQVFIPGHTVQTMEEPERENLVFEGWYYDAQCNDAVEYYTTRFSEDVTLYANWINEDDGTAYTYTTRSDGTIEILSYTGKRRMITVPSVIEGKTVTSIGEYAFYGNQRLTMVKLPETLTNIGAYAFGQCTRLTSIELPETVQTIAEGAFRDCARLSYVEVVTGGALESVGSQAFAYCGITTFEIPAKLSQLAADAFLGAGSIRSITVASGNETYCLANQALYNAAKTKLIYYPAGLAKSYAVEEGTTEIGANAFAYAMAGEITLPSGLTTIGAYAFSYSRLRQLDVPASVTSLGEGICQLAPYLSDVKFSEATTITAIPDHAFWGCGGLKTIDLPKSIQSIGEESFSASALATLNLPQGSALKQIRSGAFSQTSLRALWLPKSLEKIEDYAFMNCRTLSEVTIEDGSTLVSIGMAAFSDCAALSAFEIPDVTAEVGLQAFYNSGLKQVSIGAGLTQLGDGAFSACQNLAEIQVDAGNTAYQSKDGVLFSKDGTTLMIYPAAKVGSYTMPAGTVRTADYAFAEARQLTAITWTDGFQTIGGYTFSGCTSLTTPVLPESLTSIGENAFELCGAFSGTLLIPKNVISIGRYAFYQDTGLSGIEIAAESQLSRIGYGTFAYCGIQSFTVPRSVSTMGQEVFTGCENLRTITFEAESQLSNLAAWTFSGADELRRITFESDSQLTLIEARACANLKKLEQMNLSGCVNLKTIDNYAFSDCPQMTEVQLPEGLEKIGRYAFANCASLSEIQIPTTVTRIGRYAFVGTNNLNVYFLSATLPLNLEEYWDSGIAGYYVGISELRTSGDWTYALNELGQATITGYSGSDSAIQLSTIDGYPIIAVGGYVFQNNETLTSITLPDTLVGIYTGAFSGTSRLTSIAIPASVTVVDTEAFRDSGIRTISFAEGSQLQVIGRAAFEGTANLSSVDIPANVGELRERTFYQSGIQSISFAQQSKLTSIGRYAFAESGLQAITLPDAVTLLDYDAFYGAKSLNAATLNNGLETIKGNVFYGSGLQNITIPASVTYLGETCFGGCQSLTAIQVADNNQQYSSIDGVLFDKNQKKLITCPAGKTGSYTVASTVTTFGVGAFEGSRLSQVLFADGSQLATLGYRVFYDCDSLAEIQIPSSVMSIGNYAFAYCDNLKTVQVPEDSQLSGVYKSAFYNCTKLSEMEIPAQVQEIDDYSFYGCSAFTAMPLDADSQLAAIGDYAFAYSGLTGFAAPSQLLYIGDHGFAGAPLETLTLNDGLLELGDYAFADCGLSKTQVLTLPGSLNYVGVYALRGATELTEITVPFVGRTVTDDSGFLTLFDRAAADNESMQNLHTVHVLRGEILPDCAFQYCNYISEVELPMEMKQIGLGAFWNTGTREEELKVHFPDSLVTIGEGAFSQAPIKTAELPESLISIGRRAFYETKLTEIFIPQNVSEIGSGAFALCDNLTKFEVASDNPYFTSYDGVLYRKDFSEIIYVPSQMTGTLEIHSGPTEIKPYQLAGLHVSEIIVPETVIKIGDNAFERNNSLKKITLPTGLKEIGAQAFNEVNTLEELYIPDSVTSLGNGILQNCNSLISVHLPDGIKIIPNDMFFGCAALKEFTIPESVTEIDSRAFFDCRSLETITIPKNVCDINGSTFTGCGSLQAIYVDPENQYFASQSGILYSADYTQILGVPGAITGKVVIPDGVTTLGESLFRRCMHMTEIWLPDSVKYIGDFCFWGCDNLKAVHFGNGIQQISMDILTDTAYEKEESNWEGNVLYVGAYAVQSRENGDNEVFIRDGTTLLAQQLFSRMSETLERIWIPDSVTKINNWAFNRCYRLKNVRMSKNIEVISDNVFSNCNSLNALDLSGYTGKTFTYADVPYIKGPSQEGSPVCGGNATKIISMPYVQNYDWVWGRATYEKLILTTTNKMDMDFLNDEYLPGAIYCYVDENNSWPTGWNHGVKTYYKDQWHMATFYINECLVSMDALVNGAVVQAPSEKEIQDNLWNGQTFLGWDINGDGIADSIPTTLSADLEAHAILDTSVKGVTLQSEATVEKYEQKQLSFGMVPHQYTGDADLTWTSSDKNVVTVDNSGQITGVQAGTATVTVALTAQPEISASCAVTVTPMVGIRLSETKGELEVGETKTLTVKTDEQEPVIQWQSSDETVAVVSDGVITAVGPGNATITATCGDYTATYTLTVRRLLTGISLPETAQMNVGEAQKLTLQLEPEDANEAVTAAWASSNPSIAKVSTDGVVTPIAPGQAIITVSMGKFTASCQVTVLAPIQWITLNTTTGTLRLDKTKQLEVIYEPRNTTDDKTVDWTTENADIASVDDQGVVTAHKRGTTTITGTVGTHSATYKITVIGLRDAATGITVTNSDDTAMREDMSLQVVPVADTDESVQSVLERLTAADDSDSNRQFEIYDITLQEGSETVQPETTVDVDMPVADDATAQQAEVYRLETDGSYTKMDAAYVDGALQFTTEHFSVYVLSKPTAEAHHYSDQLSADDDSHWYACTDAGYGYLRKDEAAHQFDRVEILKAATCENGGKQQLTCSACGTSKETEIPALGHQLETVGTKAATCVENGYTGDQKCKICGAILKTGTVIPATGHTWSEWRVVQAATETNDGVESRACSICGAEERRTIPNTGHDFRFVKTVAPTCTENGYDLYRCACGTEDRRNEVAAKGHEYALQDVKSATCTENGYTGDTICSVCGDVAHKGTEIPALGHQLETVGAKAATCVENGYTGDQKCKICGAILKTGTVIPATGHTWSEWRVVQAATETNDGVESRACSICGAEERRTIPNTGHDFRFVKTVAPTCTENGYDLYRCACGTEDRRNEVAAKGHEYALQGAKQATCTDDGYTGDTICTVCGNVAHKGTAIPATGHNWSDWTEVTPATGSTAGVEKRTCSRCGAEETRQTPMLENPFTDVKQGTFCYDAVLWAVDKGITNGTTTTTFSPKEACNRGQIVVFLWRMAGEPKAVNRNNPFTDVKEGSYCYEAVLWAVENGITNGTTKTTFEPRTTCNRGQIVTFLWRAAGEPKAVNRNNPFTDVKEGSYCYEAVLWAVENGVTKGVTNTTFEPRSNCNRGQAVTFLYRARRLLFQ